MRLSLSGHLLTVLVSLAAMAAHWQLCGHKPEVMWDGTKEDTHALVFVTWYWTITAAHVMPSPHAISHDITLTLATREALMAYIVVKFPYDLYKQGCLPVAVVLQSPSLGFSFTQARPHLVSLYLILFNLRSRHWSLMCFGNKNPSYKQYLSPKPGTLQNNAFLVESMITTRCCSLERVIYCSRSAEPKWLLFLPFPWLAAPPSLMDVSIYSFLDLSSRQLAVRPGHSQQPLPSQKTLLSRSPNNPLTLVHLGGCRIYWCHAPGAEALAHTG